MTIRIFLAAFVALAFNLTAWAQIGTGVVLDIEDNHVFPGTTVDSTSTLEIWVHNELGVSQTVYFGVLQAPFSLEDDSPVEIGSNDSASVVLQFQPTALGEFSGSLTALGEVFGSATFNFSGTGIQVLLDWSPTSLTFETTAIGQTSSMDVVFTNTGNGTAELTPINDPSGIFTVEFVDTYEPPTLEPCLIYNQTTFYNYYLTVDLGSDPSNTYWYIQDDYGYYSWGGTYEDAADSMEVCLPWIESENQVGTFVQLHNYGSAQDASMTLQDGFGNVVLSLNLDASGVNEIAETYFFELGEPPASSFEPGVIQEGEIQTARVQFHPENAGEIAGAVSFQTNSSQSSLIEIPCTGTGNSEVSGEYCDVTWSYANSPYNQVGDVFIPLGCTLTIEPGVTVNQKCGSIIVEGDLVANGTEEDVINIFGGGIQWMEGNSSELNFVNRISVSPSLPDYIYFNSFESDSRADEFDCYDFETGNYYVGSSDDAWYGCDLFNRVSGCAASTSSDNYSMRYRAEQTSGYLFLADTIIAPTDGVFEISVKTRCPDILPGVKFQLQTESNGEWIVADEVQSRFYGSQLLRANVAVNEGMPINFRLFMENNTNASSSTIYIDEVIVGQQLNKKSISQLDLRAYEDSINVESGQYYSDEIFVQGDSLVFDVEDEFRTWTTEDWPVSPLSIAVDGESTNRTSQYFLSFSHQLGKLENNCSIQFSCRQEGGGWVNVCNQDDFGSSTENSFDWETEVIILPASFEAGNRVDLQIEAHVGSTSSAYDEVDYIIRDIEVFQLGSSDMSLRDLHLNHSNMMSLDVSNGQLVTNQSQLLDVTVGQGNLSADSSQFKSIVLGAGDLFLNECQVTGSEAPRRGIELIGNHVSANIMGSTIEYNWGDGIRLSGDETTLLVSHSFIRENSQSGIFQFQGYYNNYQSGTYTNVSNSYVGQNGHYGIRIDGDADIDYCTIEANDLKGIYSTSGFVTIDNSIVWFNGDSPQILGYSYNSGGFAVSYSNIQGVNALWTDDQYAWGEGCLGTDPLFIDEEGHIDPNSPCVDGGMPWEEDAHIPVGQGSSRADMGMYGGPDNDYWGGVPPPDGSVVITDVFDIPGDQGNQLGIQFSSSPFDFGGLGFNVTHYSVWRDLAVDSDTIVDVADGNWEQIGTIPAQGFNQYGYTAETLVNSAPDSDGCMTNFIVVAHTTIDNIYWVSDVAGACAVDNLAPADPDVNGLILDNSGEWAAQISWVAPEEEDYAYTEVVGSSGFEVALNNDTVVVDLALEAGATYTYTITHFDINGNASSPAQLTLDVAPGTDVISLNAGWNLISTDVSPTDPSVANVFSSLQPGNLQYVTSFDAGVEFYDPDGLSFLNSLTTISDNRGYWVKVDAADTLEITGTAIAATGPPANMMAGWNLIGFPGVDAQTPEDYFQELIAAENLLYVTGFDQGFSYFDPSGLPFLNTLTTLENGFGYWVKLAAGTTEEAGMAPAKSPVYALVNGRAADLAPFEGEKVEVQNASGQTLATLPILPGGYLMTSALFIDDARTEEIEGVRPGESIQFVFNGAKAAESVVFDGSMEVRSLELTFSTAAWTAFPNPAMNRIVIEGELMESGRLEAEWFDLSGRKVLHQTFGDAARGPFTWEIRDINSLPEGSYELRVILNGTLQQSLPVVKTSER